MIDLARQRKSMVCEQIRSRGIRDSRVLQAMDTVHRESFVADRYRALAYDDKPLPIAGGQTISQPYIVAFMIEALALESGNKVLEIGVGSGYAAAVLAEIGAQVFAVERIDVLAHDAARTLVEQGYDTVQVVHADGTLGLIDQAPFDAILVSAGAPDIPESLKKQLAVGGRMVIPVGRDRHTQELVRITRRGDDRYDIEELVGVRFVPLIGTEGWKVADSAANTGRARISSM